MAIYTLPTKEGLIQKCSEDNSSPQADDYDKTIKVATEVVEQMGQVLTRVKTMLEEQNVLKISD